MLNKVVWFSLLFHCAIFSVSSEQVSLAGDTINQISILNGIDTTKIILTKDTISPILLRTPDSVTVTKITDSLTNGYGYPIFNLILAIQNYSTYENGFSVQKGERLPKGEIWVLQTIVFLILIFAILKQTFSKQIVSIIQSFFNNKALSNLNKEDNLFTSWPFLLLFVQFGFIVGLFFYLTAQFKEMHESQAGFNFYVSISLLIIGFFALKIVVLKILGYIFNIQKPIGEYISILYLSYFNTSLLFMPLVLAFALSPLSFGEFYIGIAVVLLAIIFVFQFIRAGINILSTYRFPKVYLFLYFCTLEICPILILIKAVGF